MKTGNISLASLSPTFLKTLLNSNWDFPSIPSPLSRHHHTKLRFPQAEIWGNTQIFKYNFLATLKILLIEINMAEGRRRIRRTLLRRQRAPSPPPKEKKSKRSVKSLGNIHRWLPACSRIFGSDDLQSTTCLGYW